MKGQKGWQIDEAIMKQIASLINQHDAYTFKAYNQLSQRYDLPRSKTLIAIFGTDWQGVLNELRVKVPPVWPKKEIVELYNKLSNKGNAPTLAKLCRAAGHHQRAYYQHFDQYPPS